MFIKEYKFEDKKVGFRLTYKAKVEIEKMQLKNAEKANDEDLIKAITMSETMEDKDKELTLEQKVDFAKTVTKASIKMNELENSFSVVDTIKILLLNDHKSQISTEDEFDELIQHMDDELGTVGMINFFNEISDKVFTMLEEMKPKPKQVPQDIPMS